MVSKCANPVCSARFRYLHEGKLFRIERSIEKKSDPNSSLRDSNSKRPAAYVEFFWLCKDCSQNMTLAFDQNTGMTTRPLSRTLRAAS